MSLVFADRCAETTTTTGTGTVTLLGAKTGYQSLAAIGNGNQCFYMIAGGSQWEIGVGTYTASGTTLSRDTVLASSNSGALVSFSAGTKDVCVDAPAMLLQPYVQKVVTSGSQATIVFSSLPQYFSDIEITLQARDTTSGTTLTNFWILFNGDTTAANYDGNKELSASTAVATSSPASSTKGLEAGYICPNGSTPAGSSVISRIWIPNYTGTTWGKQFFSETYARYGSPVSVAQVLRAGTWQPTTPAAITSVTLSANTAFVDGSIATLRLR